jgi:hypothetical protein
VWDYDAFRYFRERGHEPFEKHRGSRSARDLSEQEARHVEWTDSGKGVCGRSCKRDGRIRE